MTVPAITRDDMEVITNARPMLASFMRDAVTLHRDAIMREITIFDGKRDADAQRWAQISVIKSILSSGCDLWKNISLTLLLVDVLRDGMEVKTYDDCEILRQLARYSARSVGANIVSALDAWNNVLHNCDPAIMTYDTLYAMRQQRLIMGHSHKTRRWSLAVYNARNRVYTLDVHMTEHIAEIAGLQRSGIKDNAYEMLESLMLEIHDEVCSSEMPLVSQWALWNEFRHAGEHASHEMLAD